MAEADAATAASIDSAYRAKQALTDLVRAMIANDDAIAVMMAGTPRPATGDDYNVLFDLVLDAAHAAGIPVREGETA